MRREVLLRPRNAGLREHNGEVIGPADWPAIVPEEQWRAVVALLTDPTRRTSPSDARVKWLGSGLYVCGSRDLACMIGQHTFDALGHPARSPGCGSTGR